MATFPVYQDTLAYANLKRGQLPFYIMKNTVVAREQLHHHDFAEFLFVFEGGGTEIINENKHTMQPGTATFLLPHHIHQIESSSYTPPIQLYCCMFDINILYGSPFDYELLGQLLHTGSEFPSYVDFNQEQTEHLIQIFSEMWREYNSTEFAKFSFIRTKLIEALLLFSRVQRASTRSLFTNHDFSAEGNDKIWHIIQYVHLHYTEQIDLEELSIQFKLSVPYVSRSFKKFCGKNFLDYLHSLRITNALSMLASTDMSIMDISTEVGFDSFRSFSRVFKKFKSMTPSEYRALHSRAE